MLSKNKPISFLIVTIPLILLILFSQCPEDPVDNNDLPQPLDTTSHAIFWEVDTLISIGTSSQINDVAVVNDSTIWSVGEFFPGEQITPYGYKREKFNIAKFEKRTWTYHGIYYDSLFTGQELYSFFMFSLDDIWATTGGLNHWNGTEWKFYHPWNMGLINEDEGGIRAIWGPDPDDVYFVGKDGVILHWDGSSLKRMISNTKADLRSIAGTQSVIWACGKNYYTYERVLVEYRNGTWQEKELPGGWSGSIGEYKSVGAFGDTLYLAGQSCLLIESVKNSVQRRLLTHSWIDESDEYGEKFSFNDMLVFGYADIFYSCGFGRIYHYNGRTLHRYPIQLDGWMTGIDGKDNFIVAIGFDYQTAYVFRGYR